MIKGVSRNCPRFLSLARAVSFRPRRLVAAGVAAPLIKVMPGRAARPSTRVTGKGSLDMLQMSVDTRAIERRLNSVAKSQLPFAVALGINDVAGQIKEAEETALARDLDRPAPFTKRGLAVQRATKRKLSAAVGFKRIQADYLALQATGGTRRAKRRAVVVPVNQRLNKYGNMPKGALKRALAKPDVFSGTVNGVAGVWQRPKRSKRRTKSGGYGSGRVGTVGARKGLRLLAAYEDAVKYSPRLKFVPRSHRLASRTIAPAIAKRLEYAVKTAR